MALTKMALDTPTNRWCKPRRPWGEVLGAFFVLGMVFVWNRGYLLSAHSPSDEAVWLRVMALIKAGRSAYDDSVFLGTPFTAHAVAWFGMHLGVRPAIVGMRVLNLLGVAAIVLQAGWAAWRCTKSRVLGATGVVLLGAPIHDALAAGNISPMISALTLASLSSWRRHPIAAGLLLGLGLAIKPYALLVLPIWLVARSLQGSARSARLAAVIGGSLLLASLMLLPSETARMVQQHEHYPNYLRSLSLQHLARVLVGWGPSTSQVLVVVLIPAIIWLRRRPRSDGQINLAALFAMTVGLTRIWVHTLAPLLPLICVLLVERGLWLAHAWRSPERAKSVLRLLGAALLVGVVFASDEWVAVSAMVPDLPRWIDGFLVAVPLLALFALFRLMAENRAKDRSLLVEEEMGQGPHRA